ncbi:hypothetical protein D3C80_1765040 [compost metagenome]
MSKEQVNDVMMGIHPEWRYNWCNAVVCGCMGCTNVSGQAGWKGVTKEQWEAWVASNPKPDPVPESVVDTRTPLQIKLAAYFAAGGSIS